MGWYAAMLIAVDNEMNRAACCWVVVVVGVVIKWKRAVKLVMYPATTAMAYGAVRGGCVNK